MHYKFLAVTANWLGLFLREVVGIRKLGQTAATDCIYMIHLSADVNNDRNSAN